MLEGTLFQKMKGVGFGSSETRAEKDERRQGGQETKTCCVSELHGVKNLYNLLGGRISLSLHLTQKSPLRKKKKKPNVIFNWLFVIWFLCLLCRHYVNEVRVCVCVCMCVCGVGGCKLNMSGWHQ